MYENYFYVQQLPENKKYSKIQRIVQNTLLRKMTDKNARIFKLLYCYI